MMWKKPFIRALDSYHQSKEKSYEKRFNLPSGYLRGLYYKKSWRSNLSEAVYLAALEYNHKSIEYSLLVKVTTALDITLFDFKNEILARNASQDSKIATELKEVRSWLEKQKRAHVSVHSLA